LRTNFISLEGFQETFWGWGKEGINGWRTNKIGLLGLGERVEKGAIKSFDSFLGG
jgi:hypothetical protein